MAIPDDDAFVRHDVYGERAKALDGLLFVGELSFTDKRRPLCQWDQILQALAVDVDLHGFEKCFRYGFAPETRRIINRLVEWVSLSLGDETIVIIFEEMEPRHPPLRKISQEKRVALWSKPGTNTEKLLTLILLLI